MTSPAGSDLALRIDRIEAAYEFMLAYAAQGRERDEGPGALSGIRKYLDDLKQGLDGLAAACTRAAGTQIGVFEAFIRVVDADAGKAAAAVQMVIAQQAISSQLIDNLNASIHVRALLTDLFLLDETLKHDR